MILLLLTILLDVQDQRNNRNYRFITCNNSPILVQMVLKKFEFFKVCFLSFFWLGMDRRSRSHSFTIEFGLIKNSISSRSYILTLKITLKLRSKMKIQFLTTFILNFAIWRKIFLAWKVTARFTALESHHL